MKQVRDQSAVVSSLNKLSILFLALVVIAFCSGNFFSRLEQQAHEDRFSITENANRFVGGSATLTNEVRSYAGTGDRAHYDAYWYEINTAKNRDIGLANMREIGITPAEESLITQMSDLSNGLVPFEENAMKFVEEGRKEDALDAVYGEFYEKTIRQIRAINVKLLASLRERSDARIAFIGTVSLAVSIVMGVLILLTILLQIKNMRFVRREIIAPILIIKEEMFRISRGHLLTRLEMEPDTSEVGQLIESVKETKRVLKKYIVDISTNLSEMSEGRLDSKPTIEYIGDFAPIRKSLDGILDSLNYMIREMSSNVLETAGEVTDKADSVSRGSDELAQGSSEQARVIEGLSQTVRDLAAKMDEIAESADRSNKSAADAASELSDSARLMEEMQSAMQEIYSASEGIKKITEAIGNIGSRTNIVAVNAAIEAAKAGESGRGFAVVADEVRNLAIMCRDASEQTDVLIESTLKSVDKGVSLSQRAAETLSTLKEASDRSAANVEEIAAYSKDQANSLKDVSNGFERITEVVAENARTADASAKAATELASLAQRLEGLRSLFSGFRLRSAA